MEETLTNLKLFWNMKVKLVIYLLEAAVFSNVISILSRNTLAWSITISYNHIKEEQTL